MGYTDIKASPEEVKQLRNWHEVSNMSYTTKVSASIILLSAKRTHTLACRCGFPGQLELRLFFQEPLQRFCVRRFEEGLPPSNEVQLLLCREHLLRH